MPLPTYPSSPGNKRWSIHGITGPASYTAVTPGSPPTGGQSVPATAFGLMNIGSACCTAGSDDGTYYANVFLSPFPKGGNGAPNIIVQWITAATGAEVAGATNLSARTLRILAIEQ
jgi:hypothetical protein